MRHESALALTPDLTPGVVKEGSRLGMGLFAWVLFCFDF